MEFFISEPRLPRIVVREIFHDNVSSSYSPDFCACAQHPCPKSCYMRSTCIVLPFLNQLLNDLSLSQYMKGFYIVDQLKLQNIERVCALMGVGFCIIILLQTQQRSKMKERRLSSCPFSSGSLFRHHY